MKKRLPFQTCARQTFVGALLLLTLIFNREAHAQMRLVADLNPFASSPVDVSEFRFHQTHNNWSYFVIGTQELWKSDGTSEGTVLVKAFDYIANMKEAGGIIYLNVYSDDYGYELWKSDGTEEGTSLLKDIYPGSSSSSPSDLIEVNEMLFFAANNGTSGKELWVSSGTEATTMMVKDIQPGGGSSNPSKFAVLNNKLFFVASDGSTGYELWSSDGTNAGTAIVKDIHPEFRKSSSPNYLAASGGYVYFSAARPEEGRQLWKSDGTEMGTTLVKVIREDGPTNIKSITDVSGVVFFQATDGIHGVELWKSDGTAAGTYMVKDITPGPGSATQYATEHIDNMAEVNGKLIFTAVKMTNDGQNLWVSDGTEAGTIQLSTIEELSFSFLNIDFTELGPVTYFIAMPGDQSATNLYRTDGTAAGTILIQDNIGYPYFSNPQFEPVPGGLRFFGDNALWAVSGGSAHVIKRYGTPGSSQPILLTDLGGTLHFVTAAYANGLWRTEGTAPTTERYFHLNNIQNLQNVNGTLYFQGTSTSAGGSELWKSDGTAAGTMLLKNIAPDPQSSFPNYFTGSGAFTYFRATNGTSGFELWKTDGTEEGTTMVKDIRAGAIGSDPFGLTDVSGTLFFRAGDDAYGTELWKSNGTSAGTVLVKDIYPGSGSSLISRPVAFNGKLYFFADDGVHGYEFWRSNGTDAGTIMLRDIRTGDTSVDQLGDLGNLIKSSQALYFTGKDADGDQSLWRSTGVTYTTKPLKSFSGATRSYLLGAIGPIVLLTVQYDTYSELWKSDGTTAGTIRLLTMDNEFASHLDVAVLNDVLFFTSYDYVTNQNRIWRTDGTPAGTYSYETEGQPQGLTASGSYIYFTHYNSPYGTELYLIDESMTTIATASLDNTIVIEEQNEGRDFVSTAPNPFAEEVIIHVKGDADEKFSYKVLSLEGKTVESNDLLPCNVDHRTGSSWKSGMYILQVRTGSRLSASKIVKGN
jgi:ELWxxDGT repeat protein